MTYTYLPDKNQDSEKDPGVIDEHTGFSSTWDPEKGIIQGLKANVTFMDASSGRVSHIVGWAPNSSDVNAVDDSMTENIDPKSLVLQHAFFYDTDGDGINEEAYGHLGLIGATFYGDIPGANNSTQGKVVFNDLGQITEVWSANVEKDEDGNPIVTAGKDSYDLSASKLIATAQYNEHGNRTVITAWNTQGEKVGEITASYDIYNNLASRSISVLATDQDSTTLAENLADGTWTRQEDGTVVDTETGVEVDTSFENVATGGLVNSITETYDHIIGPHNRLISTEIKVIDSRQPDLVKTEATFYLFNRPMIRTEHVPENY
jgi:hypothetical protein